MKKVITFLLFILIITTVSIIGCQQSHIIVPNPTNPSDPNSTMELWGEAANIWIQQMADNVTNEAGRLENLFKYNAELFVILFVVMLGGLAFAYLTKSSWGWVIPAVAGGGLLTLIFIVQAAVYIKWIILAVVVVALGLLVYKAWEYQKERNTESAKLVILGSGLESKKNRGEK